MLKGKKTILFVGIILFTVVMTCLYLFDSSKKELSVKLIDAVDSSYFIENIDESTEFEINTSNPFYSITNINGKKINTESKYENHILIIKPKEKYQSDTIYKLQLRDGDSFVDKNLKKVKCIYFSLNKEKMLQDKFNYEVLRTNLKEEYTLKNKQLKLDTLEVELNMKSLNKKVIIKPKNYKVFIDNKEQSLKTTKSTKGNHSIKIEFDYDGKKYEYIKEVHFKEISMDKIAREIYKKSFGEGVIIVDINQDGIPEAISQDEYYNEDAVTGSTRIMVYSINPNNNKKYLVCSKSIEFLEDMKLIKDSRLLLVGHIASDMKALYLMKFEMVNDKLKLTKYSKGSLMEDHTLDSEDPKYSDYSIDNQGFNKKEFFKKYVVVKDLY